MSEYDRMIKGLIYDTGDLEILAMQEKYKQPLYEFNQLKPSQNKEKEEYMKNIFASCGDNCYIELPFYANWGGAHLHLGNNVYANFNLTLVDDGHIYVGDYVLFGPNVTITTANHPIIPELRDKGYQYNKDIYIGNHVWIGANVVILPGVHIGDNSIIGAGSVVSKDIPANVVAMGIPCRVSRQINEHDYKYFNHNERIDWENLG